MTFSNTDVGQVIACDFVANGDNQVVKIYGRSPAVNKGNTTCLTLRLVICRLAPNRSEHRSHLPLKLRTLKIL